MSNKLGKSNRTNRGRGGSSWAGWGFSENIMNGRSKQTGWVEICEIYDLQAKTPESFSIKPPGMYL